MSNQLLDVLRKLKPSGVQGFEGLVARLLEALTGRRFYLAKSGSQEGRDMSSRHYDSNVIAVECKRYLNTTNLDERELLGELVQARNSIPDLDIWVLVATREVDSKLIDNLTNQALNLGIHFEVIAEGIENPDSLEILCGSSPTIVINFLESESIITSNQVQELKKYLHNVAIHPQFQTKKEVLKSKFCSENIGYDNWRVKQNQQFLDCLKLEMKSHAAFGQPINVFSNDVRFIERKELLDKLDSWYSNWGNHKKIFTILGEEGDGKTWGIAHWLGIKIQQYDLFPAVAFFPSNKITNHNPLILFSNLIEQKLTLQYEDCKKRVERWFNKSSENIPRLLLVLDGINERYDSSCWRDFLFQLCDSSWYQNIAIIITCRNEYWQRKFDNLSSLKNHIHKYAISSYNNNELTEALKYHQLSRSDFSDELLKLLCKPRYFNLMLKHHKSIEVSGEITVERLIYEDWKDRFERKGIILDDDKFRGLIRDLAEKTQEKNKKYLRNRDIEESLSFISNTSEVFEELITGGILKNKETKNQIVPEFLHYGFGLLLVNELEEGIDQSDKNPEEIIAEWIEPQAEMDTKAKICHYASLIALTDPNLPLKAKTALLNAWISSRNPGLDIEKEFIAYLPCDPLAYIELAEIVGSDAFQNPWAEELLKRAFMKWNKYGNILTILSSALEKWLGFLHCYGFSLQRHPSVSIEEIRHEINERAGQELKPGNFIFQGYNLTVIEDDGLLRLGRLALGLISHLPRQNFVRAIATGILAEEIMGFPSKGDLFNWVFRTAPQTVWHEVQSEVEQLLASQSWVAQKAAYRLLSYEGSQEAYQLQQALPTNLFPSNTYDPCDLYVQWSQDNYETCIHRTDLKPEWIAGCIQSICINPELVVPDNLGKRLEVLVEQISINSIWSTYWSNSDDSKFEQFEPALYAYAPYTVADLVRQIIRNIAQRTGISLRQLSFKILVNYLIIDSEEKNNIYQAWQNFAQNCNTGSDLDNIAEAYLFQIVLKDLDAEEQLSHLLNRPDIATDLLSFKRSFKPLKYPEIALSNLVSDVRHLQRVIWFISTDLKNLEADVIHKYIYPILENDDSLIRSEVLDILYKFGDNETIQNFIDSSWRWNSKHHGKENHWGSLILGKYGKDLTYSNLKNRIHPAYKGYAIRCRGMESEEVEQYADDIHQIWTKIATEVAELPENFPIIEVNVTSEDNFEQFYYKISISENNFGKSVTFFSPDVVWGTWSRDNSIESLKEFQDINANQRTREEFRSIFTETQNRQLEAGNYLFCEIIPRDVLTQIVSQRPDLVDIWLNPIQPEQDNTAEKVIHLGSTFYQILCSVLLDINHPQAIKLYQYLRNINRRITLKNSNTNICFLDYTLFQIPPNGSIENEWQRRLELCYSDLELMQLTIAAQQGHGLDWLNSYIELKLNSSAPLDFSRAVAILGFLETDAAFARLSQLKEEQPNTWKKRIVDISLIRWQTNSWAKHWFKCFMNTDERVIAWSYFKLFLLCVDRRFWLWKDNFVCNNSSDNFQKNYQNLLEDNMNKIEKYIKKNEEELGKYFLCYRISQDLLQNLGI